MFVLLMASHIGWTWSFL